MPQGKEECCRNFHFYFSLSFYTGVPRQGTFSLLTVLWLWHFTFQLLPFSCSYFQLYLFHLQMLGHWHSAFCAQALAHFLFCILCLGVGTLFCILCIYFCTIFCIIVVHQGMVQTFYSHIYFLQFVMCIQFQLMHYLCDFTFILCTFLPLFHVLLAQCLLRHSLHYSNLFQSYIQEKFVFFLV